MKSKIPADKQIKKANYEHHSNLALITTALAMISFVILMLIYMGERNPARIDLAIGTSKFAAAGLWIASAILAVQSVRKSHKYLIEYIVYMIVLGFGLFFMYDMGFLYHIFGGTTFAYKWARNLFKVLSVISAVYFLISVIWHVVLATPRKSKKK